jgi:hypothetical protein
MAALGERGYGGAARRADQGALADAEARYHRTRDSAAGRADTRAPEDFLGALRLSRRRECEGGSDDRATREEGFSLEHGNSFICRTVRSTDEAKHLFH